jgi:hypothetical protein
MATTIAATPQQIATIAANRRSWMSLAGGAVSLGLTAG